MPARRPPLAAVAAALTLAAAAAVAAPDLVHLEVQHGERGAARDDPADDVEFEEIERSDDVSRARVLAGAGNSASSIAMFVVRGFCAVAESRGTRFFRPRPGREVVDGDWVYAAEFADERIAVTPARERGAATAAADGVFSIDDCRLLGFVR